MGATLHRSPKYHCEIAGEGVEYSWGNAKMLYRRTPYSERSKTDSFMKCLKEKCLSRSYLTTERIRINSKRARDYMAAYFIDMLMKDGKDEVDVNEMEATAIPANQIKK